MFNSIMFLPNFKLASWIKVYWFLQGIGMGETYSKQYVLPDGCATIVIVLKGKMILESYSKCELKQGIYVIPPTLKVHYDLTSDDIYLIDIQLLPGVFYQLFKLPIDLLEDKVYSFKDLSIDFDEGLLDSIIKNTKNKFLIVDELDNFFTNLFNKNNFQATSYLQNLVNLYKNGNLEEFYNNEKVSHRQIQRKTKLFTGLNPKKISKVSRFYNILQSMKSSKEDIILIDIAQNNNYTDQSHFIKDFKSFTEISPKEFINNKDHYLQFKAINKNNIN